MTEAYYDIMILWRLEQTLYYLLSCVNVSRT